MIQINKRSIGICILLSLITCGIYGIYWMYLLVKNTRSIQKNTDKCTGEMLCLIFVPFYSLYWWYTRGEKVRQGFAEHDYNATGGGVVYLVLAIFGLSIVSMAIMQSDFNSLKSETHSEQRSTKKIKNQTTRLIVGTLIACLLRYLCHVLSGATVWAGISIPTTAALLYSISYNATYMIPETIVTLVLAFYISSSIDLRSEKPVRVRKESGSPISVYSIIAGLFIAGGLIYDVVEIFSKLQNADSGEFDISAVGQANWYVIGIVSAVAAVVAIVLFVIASKTKKANKA